MWGSRADRLFAVEFVTIVAFLVWGVPLLFGVAMGGATITVYDWTAGATITLVAGLCKVAEKRGESAA